MEDDDSGIIEELAADHHRLQDLLHRVRSAPAGSDERALLVERAGIRLTRHLVAERERLHPLLRRYVVDGDEFVDRLRAGDKEVERTLEALEDTPPHSEAYVNLLLSLADGVTRHVVEQEQRVFPRLQAMSPDAVLREAGAEARRAEAVAPSRPRPDAPDSPALTRLTTSVWGPWDRLRDRVTGRGRR
ncbi:hemerythrin domain-containing protein [Streptomyces bungoensis]